MPQSLSIGAFVFGAVLVLLSLVVGKFKIFGAEVEGTVGKAGRVIAFLFGVVLIATSLNLNNDHPTGPASGAATKPEGGEQQNFQPPMQTAGNQTSGVTEKASVAGPLVRDPAPREPVSQEPPSLAQKFEEYLPGTWEARAADPNTGVVTTSETRLFSNGSFSGTVSGLVNGYPQQMPMSGTWGVRPISPTRFSLTLNYVGAGSQTQMFRVIDHNSLENGDGILVRRVGE